MRPSSSGAAALSVCPVLGAIAADRHGAPCRRPVLGAIEERIGAVAARLEPRPRPGELGFVNDDQQRGHSGVSATARWCQGGGRVVAETNSHYGCLPVASERGRRGWVEVALAVSHRQSS